MITIDELRKLGGLAKYNGTGVVKLHVGRTQIYRFYSDMATTVSEDIHEHRCNFTSTVLKGVLKNYIYDVAGQDPASILEIVRSKCEANAEKIIEVPNAVLIEQCNFTTMPGESYYLAYNVLHQIERVTPKVVTLMQKEPNVQEAARIVMDTSITEYVCPISVKKSEKECWEIIEYTLNDND